MKNTVNYTLFIFGVAFITLQGCKKNNIVPPAPVINIISPTSGLAGASVTISGSHFNSSAAGNTVKFNGNTATVLSANNNTIVAQAPAGGSTGIISVSTADGTATGPVFTYLFAPTITAINPALGIAGTAITITGTNFDAAAANNSVKFNGVTAAITSATTTALVVTAPVGGSTGTVTVTTLAGTVTGPVFTYLQAPAITAISPASTTAEATVTITGTGFDATSANNVVKFNGTTASVSNATITQLTAIVPAGGSSGGVTVTTAGGTSNAFAFTYLAAASQNIYVLGSSTRFGFGYWKNSTFMATTDCSSAYAMAGSGNDIYVAGPSTTNTPTYWKNNVPVHLSAQTGYTFSIFVSGTDIYCLGQLNGTYYVWKNGVGSSLNTDANTVIGGSVGGYYLNNAIAVNNGDVYVAGAQYLGSGSTVLKARYWKNGNPVDLTDGIHSGSAWANAVFVSGNDVYVAGIEEIRDSGSGLINLLPHVWKNGVSTSLGTPSNSIFNNVSSILVKGADVYVGGRYNNAGAIWKNGSLISAATYSVAENVSSLFLYNNTDLYITGASSSSGNNCYWKNGNFVEMDPGCGVLGPNCANTSANQAISIYVK